MVESALAQGHEVKLFSTLVGMKISDVERLAKCNLKDFVIHLPDNKGHSKIPITQEYKDVLAACLTKLRVDSVCIMNDNFISNERAGADPSHTAPVRHVKGMFNCYKLDNPEFVMLPNCDIALCCNDWGRTILGNLLTQTYDEVVAAKEFSKLKANRFQMDGDNVCRGCKMAIPIMNYYAYSTAINVLKPLAVKLLNNRYFGWERKE
jgi:hypothetical protein